MSNTPVTPMPTDPAAISAMVNPPASPQPTLAATPTPVPTAPTAPSVPPAAATQPTSQPQSQPTQPKTKQEWMMHLLNKVAPPQNVITTNPDGTQTVENRATPISLAHVVLASALAGAFGTKDTYRQGAYGPILDRQASNADAFNKGQQIGKDYSEAAQKQQDDLQARKLSTVAANIQAAHGYAAMTQAQFAAQKEGTEAEAAQDAIWQKTADQNKATILASADEYDKNRQNGDPSAYLTRGQTWDELMASPFKSNMTSQLMVQDGMRPQYDEHLGRTKMVPTFSVLNPAVKVKLNEATVARIAKFNSTFGNDLFKATNGNVQLGLNQLAMLTHQASSIRHAEATLQSLSDSKDDLASKLGITGNIEDRLAAASRDNPSVWNSLSEFENGKGGGGNTAQQLQRILQSDGGDAIFKTLGTDRDKVQQFITDYNARITATNKLAEQGGLGEKAPADAQQVKALVDSINNNPNLEASDKKTLLADVPAKGKDGQIHMAQGQVEKLTARLDSTVASNKQIVERNALDQGDPVAMQTIADNVIEGDINDVGKLANYRGNARINAINAIHNEAAARGLDTTQFDEASLLNKTNTINDFGGNKKGSTGAQIASFNAFVGHTASAVQALKLLSDKTIGLTRQPAVNTAMDEIGKHLTNDPDWTAYKTSLLPVQNEISNFLAAGYATKEEDVRLMKQAIDPHETPARITAALRQLAETADVRLASMGQRYLDTIGTTDTKLVSPDSLNTFKNLGIKSRAAELATPLPRGWQNGKPQQMTDKNMAQAYFLAAGRDRNAAIALAKNNGWVLQ